MSATTVYRGWTIEHVGVSWYTYAPGEYAGRVGSGERVKFGRHHSSREAARQYIRETVACGTREDAARRPG